MSDKIKKAYKDSIHVYDKVLLQETWWSKLYIKFFWGGVKDWEIAKKTLRYIPEDFQGKMLDVPVGTGIFTWKKYKELHKASITCVDYSFDMLESASQRFEKEEMSNITLLQGDVGNLPFESETFHLVLSMNGVHAFPDKIKAFSEIYRVLQPGGRFIACFYISGQSKRTDFIVRKFLSKKGWFTPPFYTKQELEHTLKEQYATVELHNESSMVYFCCTK